MNLAIRRLVDKLYPRKANGYKIPLLGLDYSGKTTFLYRLKTGEIVTTIPTIGLSIETIRVQAGRRQIEMLCWDVGGCTKFPALTRVFTTGSDALVWIVDSHDRERVAESIEELIRHIHIISDDSANPNRLDALPILIIATKQDLPNPMSVEDIRARFAQAIKGSPVFILGSTLNQSSDLDAAFQDAFGWLLAQIEAVRAGKSAQAPPPPAPIPLPDPRSATALETKLNEWLLVAESDSSPDEFLRQFASISLPAWDHYTHIRIAYLLLTIHGRQKGKNMIFDGIEKYIAQSEQTRGRTFHVTMTYFWIQMVHFGIRRMPPMPAPESDAASSINTLVGDNEKNTSLESEEGYKSESQDTPKDAEPGADDFPRFLLLNPFVADGNLWADYYSKDVMMSPAAKAGMVLPDKKPLPNVVAREAVKIVVKGSK
ncbi:ADP-ribosylation factor [Mycena galericulata]|nr:ADP-ribosylation factor [Mycena galericulata]